MKGLLASPEEAPILITAPHSTYFDALAVVFFQLTTVVAKAAAQRVFIFGSTFSGAFNGSLRGHLDLP